MCLYYSEYEPLYLNPFSVNELKQKISRWHSVDSLKLGLGFYFFNFLCAVYRKIDKVVRAVIVYFLM